YFKPDSHIISVDLLECDDGDCDFSIEPDSEKYEEYSESDYVDDGDYFSASVMYYEENPYTIIAESMNDSYDEDGGGCFDSDDYEDIGDDLDDASDWWAGQRGDLELTVKGENKVKGVFDEVKIDDEDGDNEGKMSGSFTAKRCEIDLETDYSFYLGFF
ncbi:MAG: hypothetical protein HN348_17665, partial [Proteobacteria bacterium]|nr:hypothetical protein [Pseudomonadota bacterium]